MTAFVWISAAAYLSIGAWLVGVYAQRHPAPETMATGTQIAFLILGSAIWLPLMLAALVGAVRKNLRARQ